MPGKIVEITSVNGTKRGQTNNKDKPLLGKMLVYMDDGTKMLVKPEKIKLIGHWD